MWSCVAAFRANAVNEVALHLYVNSRNCTSVSRKFTRLNCGATSEPRRVFLENHGISLTVYRSVAVSSEAATTTVGEKEILSSTSQLTGVPPAHEGIPLIYDHEESFRRRTTCTCMRE